MQPPHDVGARHVEDLVAALVALEVVVDVEVVGLQHRARRAVGDDHALAQDVGQPGAGGHHAEATDGAGRGPAHGR